MNDEHRTMPVVADRRFELEVTADDVVRLWVDRNLSNTDGCLDALERLVRQRRPRRGRTPPVYRFLGACRDRRAGVDCLCMSFRLVDRQADGAR